ncbi:hypothetical protein RRG08_058957 [Elysia crispata]|uniref:G-protein coupled receptors family 1 profile domain-containing protein n=1 Tax=Elysia crispata TaxID=231223 RepID=A0AAE0XRK4_9GAST|nr:hypothetical protein RRG08_058957 [Elysia crispata]
MQGLAVNNTGNDTLDRDENVALIEVSVSATILCLAIVGNVCVLISLATRRKRLSRMHLMILHLSLADLFVAFFNVLPQLAWDITYRFEGGQVLCVGVKYCQVVAMYASSYVLLATAIDSAVTSRGEDYQFNCCLKAVSGNTVDLGSRH